jgi:hypothetical protein
MERFAGFNWGLLIPSGPAAGTDENYRGYFIRFFVARRAWPRPEDPCGTCLRPERARKHIVILRLSRVRSEDVEVVG